MKCGSTKPLMKKIDLNTINFEDIFLHIRSSTLKFDTKDGFFKQTQNYQSTYRRGPNDDHARLMDEERTLKTGMEAKKERLKLLTQKIKELDQKLEEMQKVLTIDINEKNYIISLKNQLGESKIQDY